MPVAPPRTGTGAGPLAEDSHAAVVRARRRAALAAVLAVISSVTALARQTSAPSMTYEAAVAAYVGAGDLSPARRLAATSSRRQLEADVARTRNQLPRLAIPAGILHLELALGVVETNPDEAMWHIRLGEQLLDDIAREGQGPDVVARWAVVASSIFQARTDVDRARAALAFGLARRPRDPRVRLHSGVIEDLASLIAENDDTGLADRKSTSARRTMYRHMATAERAYREALERSADTAPARIRLGRLLHRRGRFADARQEFELARAAPMTPADRYLLLLFLSATYEALGETTQARAALEECVSLAGAQQVAWLALAQFEERSGFPERARGIIAQGLVRDRRADADAWWDYRHGGFDGEGLQWLRGIARASR